MDGAVEIIARPNRSASAFMLQVFVVAMALPVFAVALFGYLQGNVFAPFFAVLDIGFVSLCLAWVWRRGLDHDRIWIDASEVRVSRHRRRQVETAGYPTGWVRVWYESARPAQTSLYLGAYGKRTEVGSFLAHAQRASLEALIKTRLGEARSHTHPERIENVARGRTA